jgi:hypothetical protein
MANKDPKQRYTYFFSYKGDTKPAYVTTAYSILQAIKQLEEKHPGKQIYNYFDNNGFDVDRKPFVPKVEEPKKKQTEFKQLNFKDFVDDPPSA